jgi:hypothetical protein
MHGWLLANPDADLPPLDVRPKPNSTFRIHDGRHRFTAYVLAERPLVPNRPAREHRLESLLGTSNGRLVGRQPRLRSVGRLRSVPGTVVAVQRCYACNGLS